MFSYIKWVKQYLNWKKSYGHKAIFLGDVDIEKVLVSKKISFGEKIKKNKIKG